MSTQRTDAQEFLLYDTNSPTEVVSSAFARRLKEELNLLEEENKRLTKSYCLCEDDRLQLSKQLDDLREQAASRDDGL